MPEGYVTTGMADLGHDKLKLLLHGPQGSGKTTLAGSIAEKCKTVFIDLPGEKGIKSIRNMGLDNNLTVIRPVEVGQLDDIFWDLQTDSGPVKGAEAVILESASAYQKMVMRMLMGNPENKVRAIDKSVRMSDQQTWGKLGEFMVDLAVFWFGLADSTQINPLHVIMTSQSRVKENELTGEQTIFPDLSPMSLSAMLAAPDYVGYCFVERVESEDISQEDQFTKAVRFGPHDTIATKIHEDYEKAQNLPDVLGRKSRLTIPKLCKTLDISLK